MAYYRVERPNTEGPDVPPRRPRPPVTGWARWWRAWRTDVDFRAAVALIALVLVTLCAWWFRW